MTIPLPVFELGSPELDGDCNARLAAGLLDLEGDVRELEDRLVVADANRTLEVSPHRGPSTRRMPRSCTTRG